MITFVEDEQFTKAADRLLSGDELFALMQKLAAEPEAGDMIPQSGGCRKLRFAARGKGSRGGARVIYFYRSSAGQILLLEIYAKNEKTNLSPNELKVLKQKAKS
ncbi:MAG: type II toxin-antitoxin system RelE/ParE family toxin [Verrucomicrobia bacterium]|jgi:hypothetical protein|nr:type II toxin-antitoxin system RelE/ParE family toxin [Verrucomicrobiota bacterium]